MTLAIIPRLWALRAALSGVIVAISEAAGEFALCVIDTSVDHVHINTSTSFPIGVDF
jgi:ABC-type phosphate transport system permease subunit